MSKQHSKVVKRARHKRYLARRQAEATAASRGHRSK